MEDVRKNLIIWTVYRNLLFKLKLKSLRHCCLWPKLFK